jgi:hypothetical protein
MVQWQVKTGRIEWEPVIIPAVTTSGGRPRTRGSDGVTHDSAPSRMDWRGRNRPDQPAAESGRRKKSFIVLRAPGLAAPSPAFGGKNRAAGCVTNSQRAAEARKKVFENPKLARRA